MTQIASQFLAVCIRAIDYCPPIDITFGKYFRAVITADLDLVPDDQLGLSQSMGRRVSQLRNLPVWRKEPQ